MAIGTGTGGYYETEFDFLVEQSNPMGQMSFPSNEGSMGFGDDPRLGPNDLNDINPDSVPDFHGVSPDRSYRVAENATPSGQTLSDAGPIIVDPMDRYQSIIKTKESSGNYGLVGVKNPKSGTSALGAYGIMEENVGPWSKAALGREVSRGEFLASKEIQDTVFRHQFGSYVNKYGPEGAARAWIGGESGMKNLSAKDVLGTSVGAYSADFMRRLEGTRAPGMIAEPTIKNPSPDTIPMSVTLEGKEILLPVMDAGNLLEVDKAIREYKKTGDHLGKFESSETSTAFGKSLSQQQGERIRSEKGKPSSNLSKDDPIIKAAAESIKEEIPLPKSRPSSKRLEDIQQKIDESIRAMPIEMQRQYGHLALRRKLFEAMGIELDSLGPWDDSPTWQEKSRREDRGGTARGLKLREQNMEKFEEWGNNPTEINRPLFYPKAHKI